MSLPVRHPGLPSPLTTRPLRTGPLAAVPDVPPVPSWATGPRWRPVAPWRPELSQRVGDLERSQVCDQLSHHYGEGRLDPDELDERLGAAMAARTQADLHQLLRDLPARSLPATAPPARVPLPGSGVLAVVVLLASLGVCGLMILGSLLVSPGWAVGAVIGGSVAAVGGIAIGHLWSLRR